MTVTLKQISERAGVSLSAVSQILNHRPNDYSSEATKKKVLKIARELGYKQKFGHKLLRGDRTKTMALLLSMHRLILEEQNQAMILQLLEKFNQAGYATYFQPLPDSLSASCRKIQELIARGTELFVCLGCPDDCEKIENLIKENGRSVIGYYSNFSRDIRNDSLHATRETIRQFLRSGHSNFRLVIARDPSFERISVLRELLPQYSLDELIHRHVSFLDFGGEISDVDEMPRMGCRKTEEIMTADPSVNAILYLSDYFMLGGIQYLVSHGHKIGQDILLCGHNNIHAVRNHLLPLHSWQLDIDQITDEILKRSRSTDSFHIVIPPIHTYNQGEQK